MQIKDAVTAHAEIERLAKENAKTEVRVIKEMKPGQVVRQGDIYLHRVEDSHVRGKKLKSPQLALGNTIGSRHIAEKPCDVFEGISLPKWCDQRTFLGPLIKSKKRFTVSHPEHAHVSLPAGTYQTTHQMDARTMDRVKD